MSFLYILSLTNWLSNSSLSLKCEVRRCATVSEQNEWLADCLVVGMTPGFDSIKKHMEKRMEEFARQNEFNMNSNLKWNLQIGHHEFEFPGRNINYENDNYQNPDPGPGTYSGRLASHPIQSGQKQ